MQHPLPLSLSLPHFHSHSHDHMTYPFTPNPFPFTPSPALATASGSTSDIKPNHDPFTHQNYRKISLQSSNNLPDEMDDGDSDDEDGEGDVTREEDGEIDGVHSRSGSTESKEGRERSGSRKKPRITLARGEACVACRNRKLKCTGEKPCKTCQRAKIECRYEGIQRKRPRAVMLEERIAELEAVLTMKGEPFPPSQLRGIPPSKTLVSPSNEDSKSRSSAGKISPPVIGSQPPPLSLHSHRDLPPNMTQVNALSRAEIAPNSPLELALINIVLPYTPYLLMPIHPQRFLALLTLPPTDSQRPHPALLYILFAEAVTVLEQKIPLPVLPRQPPSLFPQSFSPQMPSPPNDADYILQHVSGMALPLLERARSELDSGIRNVDRPLDLVRAAVGIARHLYGLGRFIEGWNIPVSRLLISCGLHRMSGNFIPPDDNDWEVEAMPKPYAPSYHYQSYSNASNPNFPVLRMRPVIIPPARDEIELAERVMTFWSAKAQDWESGTGWGWTLSMADEECTTQWAWGWGSVEMQPRTRPEQPRHGIRDLHDPSSSLHTSPIPDTTYVLAIKSLALLHRASHLFDRPEVCHPSPQPPSHIPSLHAVQQVETALRLFRKRLPLPFSDNHHPRSPDESYDGPSDPWWITMHANLYTAEMMMFKELAHHQPQAYETAVSCARALVGFVKRLRPDGWVHVDMIVALDLSLASRFLYKESDRLAKNGHTSGAAMASEEAEILRVALAKDYSKWLPMASLHSLIVQRVREGWPEKEGEYERV